MALNKDFGILKVQKKSSKISSFNLNRKLLYLFLMLFAVGIFISFQMSTSKVSKGTEKGFLEVFTPIGSVMAYCRTLSHEFGNYIEWLQNILSKPDLLMTLNERNKQLNLLNMQLTYENSLLREELGLVKRNPLKSTTSRVLTHPDFINTNRMIIEGGFNKGIKKGAPVITSSGLVGKIDRVSDNYSRVQVLTSIDSRIPAVIGPNRANAIVAGNNTAQVNISIKEHDFVITPGERVFTSGRGGVFPYGLLIGYISGSKVIPAVDLNKLDYVQVISDTTPEDLDND